MKHLFFFLLFLLSINQAHAQNWCDPSCNLLISFPEGGSMDATEPLTLTFSQNGLLDLGEAGTINSSVQPANTNYSNGGELSLSAGESITFGKGGVLELGSEGNINTTSLNISTTGGGGTTILVFGSINSSGTLNTDAQISLNNGDVFTDINLSDVNSFGEVQELGSLPSVSGFINSTPESQQLGTSVDTSFDNINTTIVQISTNEVLSLTSDDLAWIRINSNQHTGIINDEVTVSSSGQLIAVVDLDAEISRIVSNQELQFDESLLSTQTVVNLSRFDGFELETIDGQNCIVSENECVTDDGTSYVLSSQGRLVKAESGGGSVGGISVFLFIICFVFTIYQRKSNLNLN